MAVLSGKEFNDKYPNILVGVGNVSLSKFRVPDNLN